MSAQKLLILVGLLFLTALAVYKGYEIYHINQLKSTYAERLDFQVSDCNGIPLTDKQYAQAEAEKGDAEAAYVYASYLKNTGGTNGTYNISSDAFKWLNVASDKGHLMAKSVLCSANTAYNKSKREVSDEILQLCFDAANHGAKSAKTSLGYIYSEGKGVPQNYEEAYYWLRLDAKTNNLIKKVASHLTQEQIDSIEKRVSSWKPMQPVVEQVNSDVITRWRLVSKLNHSLSPNIEGLACKGKSRDCKVQDVCGNLIAVSCPRSMPKYLIIDTATKKEVSKCPDQERHCYDLVPEEWTCKTPDNMPLSRQAQEKFPKYKSAVSCGDFLGFSSGPFSGGPYVFLNKNTGETTKVGGMHIGQKPNMEYPKEWYCGRPSNF